MVRMLRDSVSSTKLPSSEVVAVVSYLGYAVYHSYKP